MDPLFVRAARQGDHSEAESPRAAIDDRTRESTAVRPRVPLFERIGDPALAENVDSILAERLGAD